MNGEPFIFDPRAYPALPGVYRMRSASGSVLYLGKAVDLRKRLSQYFQAGRPDGRFQVDLLVSEARSIEVIVTATERDALILENQLIKKEKPRYNIRLRDDKTYPWIRLSRDEFPAVDTSRERESAGHEYFGPFPVASEAARLLELVGTRYGLRRCTTVPLPRLRRPCLYAQLGKCSAPCVGRIKADAYKEAAAQARRILSGRAREAEDEAKAKMAEASASCEYERAAYWRDIWQALSRHSFGGLDDRPTGPRRDFVACAQGRGWLVAAVLQTSGKALLGAETVKIMAMEDWPATAASFLIGFYGRNDIPDEIRPDEPFAGMEETADILSAARGSPVDIRCGERAGARSWMALARQNAAAELSCREATGELSCAPGFLARVQAELGLPSLPERAVAVDVSSFGAEEPTGSVVAFTSGMPDRKAYRHFRIKGEIAKAGDPFFVEEVLSRYLKRDRGRGFPDLVLVDGGEAQLDAAVRACKKAGMTAGRNILALAKGEGRRSGLEKLLINGDPVPRDLSDCPVSMRLWVGLRDEAHRFAGRLNRRRMLKSRLLTRFSGLPGIGPVAERALREAFGTFAAMLEARPEALDGIAGLKRPQKEMLRALILERRKNG